MSSSSSAGGSGSAAAPPKASLSSVPPVFLWIFHFYLFLNIATSALSETWIQFPLRNLDLISPSLLLTNLGSHSLDQWVILTLLRWSTLKPAEFLSSMLPWTWPIGMVVLGLGQAMSKGGEIGIVGYRLRSGVFRRNARLVNASPCLYLICLRMNPF
jgi:hypothetical protein